MELFIETYESVKRNEPIKFEPTFTNEQINVLFDTACDYRFYSTKSLASLITNYKIDISLHIKHKDDNYKIYNMLSKNKHILRYIFNNTNNIEVVKNIIPRFLPFEEYMLEWAKESKDSCIVDYLDSVREKALLISLLKKYGMENIHEEQFSFII